MNDNKQRAVILGVLIVALLILYLFRKHPRVSKVIQEVADALGMPEIAPAIINLGGPTEYDIPGYQPATMPSPIIDVPDGCCPTCARNRIGYSPVSNPVPIVPVTNTVELVKYIYPAPPPQPKPRLSFSVISARNV